MFDCENGICFPIYVSNQKLEDSMDLLPLIDDDKLLMMMMCTSKILTDFCFTKQKIKTKIVLLKLFTVF